MESPEIKLLHDIDKKVAVIEAKMGALDRIEKEMNNLKLRVATVSATVSIIVAGVLKYIL